MERQQKEGLAERIKKMEPLVNMPIVDYRNKYADILSEIAKTLVCSGEVVVELGEDFGDQKSLEDMGDSTSFSMRYLILNNFRELGYNAKISAVAKVKNSNLNYYLLLSEDNKK